MKPGVVLSLLAAACLAGCTAVVADPDSFTPVYGELGGAMVWLEQETDFDDRVFAWWDYSKTLEQLARREPVLRAPSQEILFTVSMYASMTAEELAAVRCPECEDHGKVMDVVGALLAEDPSVTAATMAEYGSRYILVTQMERAKLRSLLEIAGRDVSRYVTDDFRLTNAAADFVVIRMARGDEVEGFEKVYSDAAASIYRLSG
jgi:hypothetical protein